MDAFSIEIFKLKLEEEGIPVMIWDERDSMYNSFGYVHLQVRSQDVDKAKTLIEGIA